MNSKHLLLIGFGMLLLGDLRLSGQPNLVLFHSSTGDYVGQGVTSFTTNLADFTLSGTADLATVNAFGYKARFDPPNPGILGIGVYTNASRFPFNGNGVGLDIFGNGRNCNAVCGSFEILEFHTDGAGQIDRFWLTFTNMCDCNTTSMTGEIRYHSQLAPPPTPRTLRVPGDFPTIQGAIDGASLVNVDTVLVSPGLYQESIQYNGWRVRVVSADGPLVTLIRPPAGQSAVRFVNGETSEAVLTGFTLTNAAGGIAMSYSSPTIVSNRIINCGTGINVGTSSSPAIRDNLIQGGTGDAIYLEGTGAPQIEGNTILTNLSGISMWNGGSPLIRNNLIRGNRGDGITMVNYSDPDIVQNLIVGNAGNGITWVVPSTARGPYVINNTIFKNAGSGLAADGFDGNSVVFNNIVVGSPALSVGGFDVFPPVIRFNDFYSPTGTVFQGIVSNLNGVAGNITADPWFACPPADDFRLVTGSPCMDVGTNGAPLVPAIDFGGSQRVRDGNADGQAFVDLGACEFNAATPPVPCAYIDCPNTRQVTAPLGQTSTTVTFPAPTGTPGGTISCSPPSGSVFPGGTNLVTCSTAYQGETVTCGFTVIVFALPAILAQPQNTNVLAGQPFTLSVVPGGIGPFRYRWMFEGVTIVAATNATLTITNAQIAHEGIYGVVVTNTIGGVTSTVARVRVVPSAPIILAQPASQSVPASSNVLLRVAVTGSEPIGYRWLFNGAPFGSVTGAQMIVSNAQITSAGNYQVLVTNFNGSATSAVAVLSVTPAVPIFLLQPVGTSVLAGASLILGSLARGTEPIAYRWRINGFDLLGATQASLVRSNLTANDSGAYTVVASNSEGMATSVVAQVTVNQLPTLTVPVTNRFVERGATIVLEVIATGIPAPTYLWQFNGVPLGATNSSLTLSNIQSEQTGYYRVTAANQYGSISSTGRVSVFSSPSSIVAWGDNSAHQSDPLPGIDDVVAVAGGDFHSLALRRDGSVVAWGSNGDGQTNVPLASSRWVAIAAGAYFNLAVTEFGGIVAWGRNDAGQRQIPTFTAPVLAVAAGESHCSALLYTGTIVGWGDNSFGQATGSLGITGCRAVAAGRNHGLALRNNGTVSGWGFNAYGQATAPQSLVSVKAIAAGYLHSVAVRSNGTVAIWGDNTFGQTNQPPGLSNVVGIMAGDFHTVALRADGSLIAWGDNMFGQTTVPATAINVVNIGSGYYHSLALAPLAPRLIYRQGLGVLVIEWTGPGFLQSAPAVTGPFSDLPGSTSSFTNNSLTAPEMFYRLRR